MKHDFLELKDSTGCEIKAKKVNLALFSSYIIASLFLNLLNEFILLMSILQSFDAS